jgi:16S rRNA (guanine1207-N2)-methyltransferase
MANEHYYSSTPNSESKPLTVQFKVRGLEVRLTTDSGVFAKKGLDYGSRLLIETVILPDVGAVVDLGCGYGAIAAVLSKVYPRTSWLLLDVNERALELARKNVLQGSERVEAVVSDGFSAVDHVAADAILLNPPIRAGKAVIYRLFEDSARHLKPSGSLWIVIHKKHGAESAKTELSRHFEHVELVTRNAGYHIFHSRGFRS